MMPKLSVVIPTYNRGRYIAQAVQSVLEQRNPGIAYEVIVVDDGSTDNTAELLSPYLDRITYQKIAGSRRPAVPRNVGIGLAKGDLIAFQDSDDSWVPNKLALQLPVLDDPSVALAYGNAQFMDDAGVLNERTVLQPGQGKSGMIFKDLLQDNFISTLTVIVRAEVIRAAGGFNESWSVRGMEDYELWLRLSQNHGFAYVDKPLAAYRQHDSNISSKSSDESLKRLSEVYGSVLKQNLNSGQRLAVRERLARTYRDLASHTTGITRLKARAQAIALERFGL